MIGIETLVSIIVTLLNVLPFATFPNVPYVAFRDSINGCDRVSIFTANESLTDFQCLRFRELGSPRPFAKGMSSFEHAIRLIVRIGSKKQMLVIDAGRVFARMKNQRAVRNWPYEQFIGDTVGEKNLGPVSRANHSVPAVVNESSPGDASTFGSSAEELCKSYLQWNSNAVALASLRAESRWPNTKAACGNVKTRAAYLARALDHVSLSLRHLGPPCRFGLFRGSRQLMTGGSLASFYHKGIAL